MVYENLKLTKANFVKVDGYFYHLSETTDTLYKKVDNGENAFSYPLDINITGTIKAIQHDGRRFWTLESAATGYGYVTIRSWEVENYILRLQQTYNFTGTDSQKFDCNAFAIEHYHMKVISGAVASGATSMYLGAYETASGIVPAEINQRLIPGDTLYIGPSTVSGSEGKTAVVVVDSVVSGTNRVNLTTGTTIALNLSDKVQTSTKGWFFNKYTPIDPDSNGTGQLYSFKIGNPSIPELQAKKTGNEFRAVYAATYLRDSYYGGYGRDFLVYVNQTNILFIDTDYTKSTYLTTVESAAQNNQEVDSTIIPIYAITHEKDTLFRLQHKATYRTGSSLATEDWTTDYNYQVGVLKRLPYSISLSADPAIIPADNFASSQIAAMVRDQFDQPVNGKTVTFTDNDITGDPGAVSPSVAVTTSGGVCNTTYTSGNTAKTVILTATA